MLVLKILGFLAIIITIFTLAKKLNKKFIEKFNFPVFSIANFVFIFIDGLLLGCGKKWYKDAIANNGDKLNGLILLGIGIVLAICIILAYYHQTNFIYGTIGSVINLSFVALIYFFSSVIIALIIIGIVGTILGASSAKPVYVINK